MTAPARDDRWLCGLVIAALGLWLATTTSGCATSPRQAWESLKGQGFPEWNESVSSGMRGDRASAKPSGFFTDRRSEQIEQNLGGGF